MVGVDIDVSTWPESNDPSSLLFDEPHPANANPTIAIRVMILYFITLKFRVNNQLHILLLKHLKKKKFCQF